MSELKSFRGVRPAGEYAARIASPPYDVLNSAEARIEAEGNPLSFLHVVKPEIDLEPDVDVYDPRVYQQGAENLKRLVSGGYMIRDEKPCYYIYRQQMGEHVQTGLVACASVDEYERGLIKKHEFTRPRKEDDRTRHIETLNAQAGPVFLTYRKLPGMDDLIDQLTLQVPEYDFTSEDKIRHTFWTVSDPEDIDRLHAMIRQIPALYVADGHHRSAAACRVRAARKQRNSSHNGDEEYNFFLTVVFPHDQMLILPYNRVVKDLNGRTPEALLKAVSESFEVEEREKFSPERPRIFSMYVAGKWYRLKAKPGTYQKDDPVESLDVSILQNNLLTPVLGIQDPRTDDRIDFVGGIRGLEELERRADSEGGAAFALFPTSIDELMAIADAGKVMPPKSTWFEPKLRSGLILHSLAE